MNTTQSGFVLDRLDGALYGHAGLSLVTVNRAAGVAFALERMRRGDWRRLHSLTVGEARALCELIAAYMALADDSDPGLGAFNDDAFADVGGDAYVPF